MWLLFHVGPIKDEKGEVMLFLVTLKDITEYKDPIVGPGNIDEYVRLYHHSFSHIVGYGKCAWLMLALHTRETISHCISNT